VGTRASVRSPWGTSTHLIQPFKNAVLSRNLDQNMPKNAYFLKKAVKLPLRQGAPLPNPRWRPSIVTFANFCSFC